MPDVENDCLASCHQPIDRVWIVPDGNDAHFLLPDAAAAMRKLTNQLDHLSNCAFNICGPLRVTLVDVFEYYR